MTEDQDTLVVRNYLALISREGGLTMAELLALESAEDKQALQNANTTLLELFKKSESKTKNLE